MHTAHVSIQVHWCRVVALHAVLFQLFLQLYRWPCCPAALITRKDIVGNLTGSVLAGGQTEATGQVNQMADLYDDYDPFTMYRVLYHLDKFTYAWRNLLVFYLAM